MAIIDSLEESEHLYRLNITPKPEVQSCNHGNKKQPEHGGERGA